MKTTRLLILSLIMGVFISVFTQQKIAAHRYCESYINCDREPEVLEKIDYWTNYFFKLSRPEMRNKPIRIHHTLYRREKAEIRRVINKVLDRSCQQPNLNRYYLLSRERERKKREPWQRRDRRNRIRYDYDRYWERDYYYDDERFWDEELWEEGYYWGRTEDYFFDGLYRDLTDAVFYARHPELARNISRKSTINWSTEWMFIRQSFADFEQEEFLKQHLIPLCDRYRY